MLRMIATTTITNQEILSVKMHVNANKPHSTGVAYNTVQKRRESAALFLRLGYMMIITMVSALSLSLLNHIQMDLHWHFQIPIGWIHPLEFHSTIVTQPTNVQKHS